MIILVRKVIIMLMVRMVMISVYGNSENGDDVVMKMVIIVVMVVMITVMMVVMIRVALMVIATVMLMVFMM